MMYRGNNIFFAQEKSYGFGQRKEDAILILLQVVRTLL
jgi:hypothetical protein